MFHIPVLGVCAYSSGMGKTTLLAELLPALASYGLKVSVVKQARADFDLDRPGKDSHRLREAGACQVLLSSPTRWALLTEQEADTDDTRLPHLLRHFDPALADIVLVEGFRHAPIPKIEVHRPVCGKPLLAADDPHVIAVASDAPVSLAVPVLDLNDADGVAGFILGWLAMRQEPRELAVAG